MSSVSRHTVTNLCLFRLSTHCCYYDNDNYDRTFECSKFSHRPPYKSQISFYGKTWSLVLNESAAGNLLREVWQLSKTNDKVSLVSLFEVSSYHFTRTSIWFSEFISEEINNVNGPRKNSEHRALCQLSLRSKPIRNKLFKHQKFKWRRVHQWLWEVATNQKKTFLKKCLSRSKFSLKWPFSYSMPLVVIKKHFLLLKQGMCWYNFWIRDFTQML